MIPLTQIFETGCCLFALFFLRKDRGVWVAMIFYLLIILAGDWTGYGMMRHGINNQWLYNIVTFIDAIFLKYILMKIFPKVKAAKILGYGGMASFALVFLAETIMRGFAVYANYSAAFNDVWMIIFSLCYFYYFLEDTQYYSIRQYAAFWMAAGIFLFYFGSFTADICFNYFIKISVKQLRTIIFIILNFILYSCWSYAFICRYRQKK